MKTIHYTAPYLLNPTNPVTVHLIGAGGTGSQVLTALAKMNHAMIALDHPGLHVTLWDADEVSKANLGRQLFAEAELGLNKAVALISRVNRFFGTNWKARPIQYRTKTATTHHREANIIITCVDTVAARLEIGGILKRVLSDRSSRSSSQSQAYYWLDFGNSQASGQVILATVGEIKQGESDKFQPVASLPFITDEFGDLLTASETEDNSPSCSVAEALLKQDLFINSTLANLGCGLLWNMFRQGKTHNRGLFLNLADLRSTPLSV